MKSLPWLLGASLAANLALLVCLLRSPPAPVAPTPAAGKPAPGAASAKAAATLQAALASGDAAALAAAGVPADTIRALTVGRAFDLFQGRMRATRPPSPERYWSRGVTDFALLREQRLVSGKAERDFSETVRLAYGEDLEALFGGGNPAANTLSPEKRERMRQIERDYSEMAQMIYAEQASGVSLPSDREKLKLLEKEKQHDLAAILTPAEHDLLALRESNSAENVRNRFGDVLATEEDYKKVFALQKTFDDRFNGEDFGPERREAERKLMDDIRAVLRPDQWAAAERANDPDIMTLNGVTRRLNLDSTAATTVLALRENYAGQSMRINADSTLSASERKTQLQALAVKAESEVTATLGPEGGPPFVQQALWIGLLKDGRAFSLDPKDSADGRPTFGPRTYPVAPPKMAPRPTN